MSVKLITVDAVRARMKLEEDEAIDIVISSAIQGMAVGLGSRLRTRLTRGTTSEVFCLTQDSLDCGGTYRLMLRNGFVQNVVVSSMPSLTDDPALMTPLNVDPERGIVIVPSLVSISDIPRYIKVEYTYGFLDKDSTVPDWLAEVALCYAVQLMSMQQLNDLKAETKDILSMITSHVNTLINPSFRVDARAVHPIM